MNYQTPAANVAAFLDVIASHGTPQRVPFVLDDAPEDPFGPDPDDLEGGEEDNYEAHGADQGPGQPPDDISGQTDADVRDFRPALGETIAAVDANMTRLGVSAEGLVVALRAACTVDTPAGGSAADLVRTGPLHLRMKDRGHLLHRMGIDQSAPDFFVTMTGDPERPVPVAKPGAANHAAILADRVRNHIERIMQVHTLGLLPPSALLLLDSSLTQRTRDTTPEWWEAFTRAAAEGGVSLVAVSKRSALTVQDRPVAFWLDDHPARACYRRLTALLHGESPARAARNLGGLYAVRFSAHGPTLRVDVLAAGGRTEAEVLDAVVSSCAFRGGMPEPLVRAHALAYTPQPAFQVLQTDAAVTYGLDPRQDEQLGPGVYGFSAGRFK